MNLPRPSLLSLFGLLISLQLFAPSAKADVWIATKTWDDTADAQFSAWIKQLPMDIFSRKDSPYYGIATDCAEAVYTLRTIFAYENSLPVNFVNPARANLANTNSDFDSTPAGLPRLKRFVSLLKSKTNTATLTADTYPIEINRTYLKAGAVFLHPQSGSSVPITYRSGHVYYIQDVFENGMVSYFSSTVPAMVRDLQTRIDIDFAPMNTDGGYRAWKHPGASPPEPGLSREQFSFANWHPNAYGDGDLWDAWQHVIRQRLALRDASPTEELKANLQNVAGYMKERNHLIQMSWSVYQHKYHGQSCMSDADYEDYATPTRDVKIQSELQSLQDAARIYLRAEGQDSGSQGLSDLFSKYTFEVMPGVRMDLNQLWTTFETTTVLSISEPEHSPKVRWGLETQPVWPCPNRAKQYRGGDQAGQG